MKRSIFIGSDASQFQGTMGACFPSSSSFPQTCIVIISKAMTPSLKDLNHLDCSAQDGYIHKKLSVK